MARLFVVAFLAFIVCTVGSDVHIKVIDAHELEEESTHFVWLDDILLLRSDHEEEVHAEHEGEPVMAIQETSSQSLTVDTLLSSQSSNVSEWSFEHEDIVFKGVPGTVSVHVGERVSSFQVSTPPVNGKWTPFPDNTNGTTLDAFQEEYEELFGSSSSSARATAAGCLSASEVFQLADANGDGVLNDAEAEKAASLQVVLLMRRCHRIATSQCVVPTPTRSTSAEVWGFSMLVAVLMVIPAAFGCAAWIFHRNTVKEFATVVGLPVGVGAHVGLVVFLLIPYFSRAASYWTTFSLNGPNTVTPFEYDFVFPFVCFVVALMMTVLAERAIHACHRIRPPMDIRLHDGLVEWEELEKQSTNAKNCLVHVPAPIPVALFTLALLSFAGAMLASSAIFISTSIGLRVSIMVCIWQLLIHASNFSVLASFHKMSIGKVVILNLLFSLPAFIGAIIGAAVGPSTSDATRYLMAFVSGVSMVHSLGQMTPQINKQEGWKYAVLQTLILIVPLIALYVLSYFLTSEPIC